MNRPEPIVTNAADTKQLGAAKGKQKDVEREQLDDVRAILDVPEGRRFLWRMLAKCKVNESIFEPNSRIAYNAGVQDVGHFILGEIVKARPEAYLQMMVEHMEEGK